MKTVLSQCMYTRVKCNYLYVHEHVRLGFYLGLASV